MVKPRTAVSLAILTATVAACAGGLERECGFGTELSGEECVTVATCGPGTTLVNGECTAEQPGSLGCTAGTVATSDGSECVLASQACQPPSQLDSGTGRCVAPTSIACGTGTVLDGTVCVPSCPGPFETQNTDKTGCVPAARLQVYNALAGDAVSTVDIWAGPRLAEDESGTVVGDDLAYGEATPVFKHPVDALLLFSRPDASSPEDAGFTSTADEFNAGEGYFVVLHGVGPSGTYDRSVNPAGNLTLDYEYIPNLEEANGGPVARLGAVHAVADLSAVGLGRQRVFGVEPATELISDISYSNRQTYIDAPSERAFDVYDANTDQRPILSLQLSSLLAGPVTEPFPPGGVAALVLQGFRNPAANPGNDGVSGPPLTVVAVTPDGSVYPLDEAARIQVIHAGLAPGSTYDVAASSESFAAGLAQYAATPVISTLSRVELLVAVSDDGGTTAALSETMELDRDAHERWVIIGEEGDVPGLELARVRFNGDRLSQPLSGLFSAHGLNAAANVGAVDFQVSPLAAPAFGAPELPNLSFGDSSSEDVTEVFEDQRVTITPAGSPSPLASFDVTLTTDGFNGGDTLLFIVTGSFQPTGQSSRLLVVNQEGTAVLYTPN